MSEEISIENRLRELRKQHRLSQEELADALGISRQSIIAIEQGKYLPSLPLVVSMCQFFNSAFEDLFEFEQQIQKQFDDTLNNKKINIKILNGSDDSEEEKIGNRKEQTMPGEMEPWRPFREAVSLRDAMDRLFEDSFITPKGVSAMPKIDVKDKKDAIEVKAELPGMTEDQVNVEISDGIMTISGEKIEEKEEKEEGYYHKESHSGAFSRSFTLPADVMEEKAEAEMDKGILTVRIPKIEPKKATKVKVAPKKK